MRKSIGDSSRDGFDVDRYTISTRSLKMTHLERSVQPTDFAHADVRHVPHPHVLRARQQPLVDRVGQSPRRHREELLAQAECGLAADAGADNDARRAKAAQRRREQVWVPIPRADDDRAVGEDEDELGHERREAAKLGADAVRAGADHPADGLAGYRAQRAEGEAVASQMAVRVFCELSCAATPPTRPSACPPRASRCC